MKSRITIEVDFENGNQPTIQILRKESGDVRDSLITAFIQSLGHYSQFLHIQCVTDHRPNHVWDEDAIQRWHITPVTPEKLLAASETMKADYENSLPKSN
jgi:hypothetical protein